MTKPNPSAVDEVEEFTNQPIQLKQIQEVSSRDEAQQIAIDWQRWVTDYNDQMSYGELAEYGRYFTELAEKFDLTDEFTENGII